MTRREFDAALAAHAPQIPWHVPIRLTLQHEDGTTVTRWGCRLCIARVGLKGVDIPMQYVTQDACEQHIAEVHG